MLKSVLPEISGNLPFVAGKHIAGNHADFAGKRARKLGKINKVLFWFITLIFDLELIVLENG